MSTADQRRITIQANQQGGWVRVAISDTGAELCPIC